MSLAESYAGAFDAERTMRQISHLIPAGTAVSSLDDARLPTNMLTDQRRYLAPINFATNFAFFRDGAGRHTRLVTANYHMPRSLQEFRAVMPNLTIVPHPVFPAHIRLNDWWRWPGTAILLAGEYNKLLLAPF